MFDNPIKIVNKPILSILSHCGMIPFKLAYRFTIAMVTWISLELNQIALISILRIARNMPTPVLIRFSEVSLWNIQQFFPGHMHLSPVAETISIVSSKHREGSGHLLPGLPFRFPPRIVGGRKTQRRHDKSATEGTHTDKSLTQWERMEKLACKRRPSADYRTF